MEIKEKNIAIGAVQDFLVDEGIIFLKLLNNNDLESLFDYNIDKSHIQFHFCLKGDSKFQFNNGSYSFPVASGNSILLYNPNQELPIKASLASNSLVLSCLLYTSDAADE